MLQTFGGGPKEGISTGVSSPPPEISRSFWARIKSWFFNKLGATDVFARAVEEFAAQLDSTVAQLLDANALLVNKINELEEIHSRYQAEIQKWFQEVKEITPCHLTPCAEPVNNEPVPSDMPVELVSLDGKHKFLRPLTHKDVREVLESGDFVIRKPGA